MEEEYDFSVKVGDKSDKRDIVDFVKEVEKYPCLYDKTLPAYANKVHNRRAWSAIAKRANTSVPDCRDKWRKIRISYMRSLKQQASSKPPMRPYYLTEVLHFLTPFMSVQPQKKEVETKDVQPKDHMDFEVSVVGKQEISDSENSVCYEPERDENVREINRVIVNDDTIPNIMNGRIDRIGNCTENGYGRQNAGRNSYSDDIESNPRKMFLLSMLPDIESFTEPEMRIFRREVISIIDTIISQRSIRN